MRNVGDSVVLSLKPIIFRQAFHNPNLDPLTSSKASTKSTFSEDAAKETAFEQLLAKRKNALNALFDRTNLQPIQDGSSIGLSKGGSTRGSLEKYDAIASKKSSKKKKESSIDLNEAEGLETEEGIDGDGELIDQNALNMVYQKAKKNDSLLPEMDPPGSFKLSLRPYQKQALRWMSGMEGMEGMENAEGELGGEREISMHPLWEEYRFPGSNEEETFYYNPYSGELSLIFPKASKKCLGGILADG